MFALLVVANASAAELPAGVFQMADGSFYQPSTGRKASSLVELGYTVAPVEPLASSASAPASAPEPEAIVIFRMADGVFFHPGTGLKAASEVALRASLAGRGIGAALVQVGSEGTSGIPVLDAAYRAKAELRQRIAADQAQQTEKRVVGDEDFWRDVTLAVWNRKQDSLSYVTGRKKGTQLILNGSSDVSVRRSNYINSEYVMDNPDELVVAVRYPIAYGLSGVKDRYELRDEVYTPYTRDLHTKDIVAEGERHLDGLISGVLDSMRRDQIMSRSQSGQLMADVVDPALIKSLIVIEHTNLSETARNAEQAVERVYVTLALNRGETYNYSRSSAGALGLVQFIPSTYNSFARRLNLKLNKDFETGMRDHANAVRAQIAHIDDSLANLPEDVRRAGTRDPKVQEYLAAAYNGGYARVRTAIKIWDEQISGELKPAEILKRSRLHSETIQYVKKLRQVRPVIASTLVR